MKTILLLSSLMLAFTIGSSTAAEEAAAPIKVGDKAPAVEGKDQSGKDWKLSDELGKKAVLLYFYPKDDTAGCTKQACGFRDSITELDSSDIKVVGVSCDTSESHQKFIEKYSLNFPLIADTDGKIAQAFGVKMKDRNMARRVSFLIGKDGKVTHVTDSGNADQHITEMKKAAIDLKKS
jgi:thioredoxin-dependent peroxiredoxin